MKRKPRVDVSKKARRLVERAVRLHVEQATAVFQPTAEITLAESNVQRDALHHRAWEAKRKLLEYICQQEKS